VCYLVVKQLFRLFLRVITRCYLNNSKRLIFTNIIHLCSNSANADTTKGRSSIPSNQDITIPKTMAHQSSASPVRPPFIGSSGIRAPQQKHRGSVSSSVSTASAENVQMQQLAMDDEDDDEDAARELEKLRKEVEALKSSP